MTLRAVCAPGDVVVEATVPTGSSAAEPVDVVRRVLVTARAVSDRRLTLSRRFRALAAVDVLRVGDGLEVAQIHTCSVATEMVELVADLKLPVDVFPDPAVGELRSCFEAAVAALVETGCPEPAVELAGDCNLFFESLERRL
jgi:hypothetical protein